MPKILIVDDSSTVRQQVRLALRQGGFEVVEASDGVEGVAAVKSRDDIALVISDVNMPNMDGLEMVETLKGNGANADLPILMLTTEGSPALIKRAKRAGASGWLVKPFKAHQLLAVAQKFAA